MGKKVCPCDCCSKRRDRAKKVWEAKMQRLLERAGAVGLVVSTSKKDSK